MSEEYKWRQLGSVVNTVMLQARTQAMRSGSISKAEGVFVERSASAVQPGWMTEPRFVSSSENQPSNGLQLKQLALPFGVELATHPSKRSPVLRSRSTRRVMH